MVDLDAVFNDDRAPSVATATPTAVAMSYSDQVAIRSPEELPEAWRVEYEERAAIREYDGGQAREHAEAEALAEVLARMRAAKKHL